ncbi:MAG: hypothetical protein KC613_17030, partial [Myxococcales bacterium]|nr:hypothetical protein [Myxococcales bacterium]
TAMSKAGVAWHSERRAEFGRKVTVPLHPWPFEQRWTKTRRQREAKTLIERSTLAHARRREAEGVEVMGAERMRAADPRSRTKNPQTGTGAPRVRGTAQEVADYLAGYAEGMEARERALDAAAEALDLTGWGDDFAIPGPLEAALRRTAEQRAKVAANLTRAGHGAEDSADPGPTAPHIPTFAELDAKAAAERQALKVFTRTRRMKRRQQARNARVRLGARRRRRLAAGPTRRCRGRRLLARSGTSRRRPTQRVVHHGTEGPDLPVVIRPLRLSRPTGPDPGG